MKRPLIIHPFLFGLFFVLALYSANVAEVSPTQVLMPMVVVTASTIVILVLARMLLRNFRRAALLTSVALILCFSYGHVVNLVVKTPGANYNFSQPESGLAMLIWVAWALLFGASIFLLRKIRRIPTKLTTLLNIVGTVLVVMPLVNIVIQEARGSTHRAPAPDTGGFQLSVPEPAPDIYYIIVDRYASASTLEESYGFDNGEFLDYLSGSGFYVASDSRANYFSTEHSLASSLNMTYLDDLSQQVGETAIDEAPFYEMMENYEVWRSLKSVGYEFIHFGSWWEPTRENKYADVNVNYSGSLPEFSMLALRTTAIDPVGKLLGLWGEPRRTQWERCRYEFRRLAEIPEIEEPTFVFAHFLLPHPDYVFNRDGSFAPPITTTEVARRGFEQVMKERYIDQLVATNDMVESLIQSLLETSDNPPIIIIQADEGPIPRGSEWSSWDWSIAALAELREKTGILNAYYLPGTGSAALYPSITPVNSFRLVFNLYFGTNLDRLEDLNYAYWQRQPYKFYDVTERLLPGAG